MRAIILLDLVLVLLALYLIANVIKYIFFITSKSDGFWGPFESWKKKK